MKSVCGFVMLVFILVTVVAGPELSAMMQRRSVTVATIGTSSQAISVAAADVLLYNNDGKMLFTPSIPGNYMLCINVRPVPTNAARVDDPPIVPVERCASVGWLRSTLERGAGGF